MKYHWLGKKADLVSFDSLEPEEKKIVAEDVLNKIYLNGSKDHYRIYAEVLASWGIVCPHPQHMRLYSGNRSSPYTPLDNHRWYDCEVCGCSTFNEDFATGKRAKVG